MSTTVELRYSSELVNQKQNDAIHSIELLPPQKYTYSLYKDNGEPCILVQTDCSFELKFWTKRRGRDKTRVVLPKDPEVTGRCVYYVLGLGCPLALKSANRVFTPFF